MKNVLITLIYWLMTVVLLVVPILTDFIRLGFETSFFTDVSYWMNVFTSQIPVVIVMYASRSYAKIKERTGNTEFQELHQTVRNGYAVINKERQSERFSEYVAADDRRRKLTAYITRLSEKIAKHEGVIARIENAAERRVIRLTDLSRKRGREVKERNPIYIILAAIRANRITRHRQKIRYLEQRKEAAPREIDFIRVRYIPITVSIVFGEIEKSRTAESDLRAHESRDLTIMTVSKVATIVAFGVMATSSAIFDFNGDTVSIIYKAIVKVAQMATSVLFGQLAGIQFVRGELINSYRKKVTYIQQFRDKTSA